MNKSDLKKEMEDSFNEMESLVQKAGYIISITKKYPEVESLVEEASELMRQWSKVAKRYVAASKEYHSLFYKHLPI